MRNAVVEPSGRRPWEAVIALASRLRHSRAVWLGAAGIFLINVWAWGYSRNDVLEAAYAVQDGGGYCSLKESGVSQTIKHNGSVILPASSSGGSYCCGYTFQVAMNVAERRGSLKGKSVDEVRRFQKVWYGTVKGSGWKQCAQAVTELGIGREVKFEDAEPGDFMALHRVSGMGHSVVFLNWVRNNAGDIVGLRYRSAQPGTGGVADAIEFFAGSGFGADAHNVKRDRLYVARLDRPWWSRLLYPFG